MPLVSAGTNGGTSYMKINCTLWSFKDLNSIEVSASVNTYILYMHKSTDFGNCRIHAVRACGSCE